MTDEPVDIPTHDELSHHNALLIAEMSELRVPLDPIEMLKLRLDVLTAYVVHHAWSEQFEYAYEHALNQLLLAKIEKATTPELIVPQLRLVKS